MHEFRYMVCGCMMGFTLSTVLQINTALKNGRLKNPPRWVNNVWTHSICCKCLCVVGLYESLDQCSNSVWANTLLHTDNARKPVESAETRHKWWIRTHGCVLHQMLYTLV